MMNFFRCGLVAAFIFLTTTPAMAATAAELTACKTESEPAGCFAGLKQACDTNDETCVNNIELARACWQAEDAVAKIAAAEAKAKQLAEELAAVKAAPAPAPAAPAPMPAAAPAAVPVYPVLELTAPETTDPPLRAYSYKPAGCGVTLPCAKIEAPKALTEGARYIVSSPEGPIPVVDRLGRVAPPAIVDFDADGSISPTEMAGMPATFPNQSAIYLVGSRSDTVKVVFDRMVASPGRLGYWEVDRATPCRRNRTVFPTVGNVHEMEVLRF
jgi:hypothetical protein